MGVWEGRRGGGGCTNACLCMGSHNQPLLTEPLHIQVRPNYLFEGSLLWQTFFSGWKASVTKKWHLWQSSKSMCEEMLSTVVDSILK